MADYLSDLFFDPVPRSLRTSLKALVYLIRASEALIIVGLGSRWYHSKAFGFQATQNGFDTDSGKLIFIVVLAASVIGWWRPFKVPLSRYAWGMAFVGAIAFLLAYGETGGDPEDNFALELGIYATMAGGILRLALGVWLALQLEKHEKVLAFLGLSTLDDESSNSGEDAAI